MKGKDLCMYLLTMVQSDRQILRLLSRVNALPMAAAVCMLPRSFRGPQAVMAGLCAGVGLGIRELRVATAPQPDPLTQVFSHLPERRTYLC